MICAVMFFSRFEYYGEVLLNMVNIAILGHGVVGSGVAEVILSHEAGILRHAREGLNIQYVLDRKEFPDSPLADRFTKNFEDILGDESVSIVVEVMGGLNPAFDFVKRCLLAGKSVVTSNKELVAAKGAELLEIAQAQNVNFMFEASVGGGIPIIRPLYQCLAANDVLEIAGILNGTTNFILTKMIDDHMDFADALALAQKLGYAERDPSADVDGHDACRKICILASLAFGKHVYPEQVHTEGISGVSLLDVDYAKAWEKEIKLIGHVKRLESGSLHLIVCPMLVPSDSLIATIDDVFNGIMVRGDATDEVLFYGKGAGKLPTASAVVADVMDCMKHVDSRKYLFWEDTADASYVQDYLDYPVSMYVRVQASDEVSEQIPKLFGNVSWLACDEAPEQELAFVTAKLPEREIRAKLEQLQAHGAQVKATIRVADFV